MHPLYHIAIIEGFLANSVELPSAVKEAIAFFKNVNIEKPPEPKIKKKRKYSAETREKMRKVCNKMRQDRLAKIAERQASNVSQA